MRFLFRRIVSYAIDFVIFSLLIGLFTFSINVFYADPAMQDKVLFMFVCALIVSLGLTTYIPVQNKGQTIGQKIMKIQIEAKNLSSEFFKRRCGQDFGCADFCGFFCNLLFCSGYYDQEF